MDALSALFQALLSQLFREKPEIAILAIKEALIGLGEDAWNAFAAWYEQRREEGWPPVEEFQPVPLPMPQNGPSDLPPEP